MKATRVCAANRDRTRPGTQRDQNAMALAAARRPRAERSNKRFLIDLARDWEQHGPEVFKRVRRESPAAYLKICAMLVPRGGLCSRGAIGRLPLRSYEG
jgi:hypothetical protein